MVILKVGQQINLNFLVLWIKKISNECFEGGERDVSQKRKIPWKGEVEAKTTKLF